MRVHDGPRAEPYDPEATSISWGHDYGTRGGETLERPYIDDEPAVGRGSDIRSRWGSRPGREIESGFDTKRPAIEGLFHRVWSRARSIVR